MKKLIVSAIAASTIALGLSVAAPAQADSQDYFNTLADNNFVVWDYPLALNQGHAICNMLRDNVNPYSWLLLNGYDSSGAGTMIASARIGLCPGNAVT
jgi:hypothetical protein